MKEFRQRIITTLELLENTIDLDSGYINQENLNKVSELINEYKKLMISEQENSFWQQCIRFVNKPISLKKLSLFTKILTIQMTYLRLIDDFKMNEDIYLKNLINSDTGEWLYYFWNDIMNEYFSVMSHFNYHDAFQYDNLIRCFRSIDEKLTFWVFVMIDGKEKWGIETIRDIYDYNLNVSRLRFCMNQGKKTEYLLNGKLLKQDNYVETLERANENLRVLYFKNLKKVSDNTIKDIKETYNLNDEQIAKIKELFDKKEKNFEIFKLFENYDVTKKALSLTYEHKEYENVKEEINKKLLNQFSCLIDQKKFPRNIYDHVDNVIKAEGKSHGFNLKAISQFKEYVNIRTGNEVLLQLSSNIEYNLSNHIQFDNIIFNSNELSILTNKLLPITFFSNEFERKYGIYVSMLVEEFHGNEMLKEVNSRWNEINKEVNNAEN